MNRKKEGVWLAWLAERVDLDLDLMVGWCVRGI